MSKLKENIPTQNAPRGSVSKVNLIHTGQSDEFFTDSILESDATRTSKIPTPLPQKSIHTRSHRARKPNKSSSQRKSRTAIDSTGSNEERLKATLQPPISIRRSKSPSPLRTDIAATPPQTRNTWDLESPSTDLRSPPPREFTDVYRQIADEEDLAATEREFSDSDGSLPFDDEDEPAVLIRQQPSSRPGADMFSARSHTSRGSTPVQQTAAQANDYIITRSVDTMSEPTGMSFLNELTDQRLAAALTPHMSESAKDRARLREVWSNQKPVAFGKVRKASPNEISLAHDSEVPVQRVTAFSKAAGLKFRDTHSDPSFRPASRHSDGSIENYQLHNNHWDDSEQPLKPLPTNTRIERNFHFSRHHGFPTQRAALTERNLQQQNHIGPKESQDIVSSPGQNGLLAKTTTDAIRTRINSGSDYSDRAQRIRETLLSLNKPTGNHPPKMENSQIDWQAAAGSGILPPNNGNTGVIDQTKVGRPIAGHTSPEKNRKWDIDLTGHSFQVSESPPVRNKVLTSEGALGKEIESLTKRAVTTSRLGEIREKHSQEGLRSKSRSPARRSSSISEKRPAQSTVSPSVDNKEIGEAVPNTPVVIYRSSSNSSDGRKPAEHVTDQKTNSDELMQRFVRATSNTPKSSPASAVISKQPEHLEASQLGQKPSQGNDGTTNTYETTKLDRNGIPAVAATPKIIGAWTDTILPDTVKTIKQQSTNSAYLKTPHVSAGGWIDTPLPSGVVKADEMTPIIEEVPEELTSGFVKNKDDGQVDDRVKQEDNDIQSQPQNSLRKIGLAAILDRAARGDDTLNLGNETIESFQDLLTLDHDEMTILSKVFNEDDGPKLSGTQEEAATLERMVTKLDRMRTNLREAKKGISRLEYEVLQPVANSVLTRQSPFVKICSTCQTPYQATSDHSHSAILPVAPLRLNFSVPLLFYPETISAPSGTFTEKKSFSSWLPRPTPLGWITITIWLWYFIECALSEVYSHPTHAEYYVWPATNVSEPDFPYVLPTMLSRWLQLQNLENIGFFLFGWFFTFARASFKVLGMWLGWTDGFMDDRTPSTMVGMASASGSAFSSVLRSLSSTAVGTALGGVETDLSMMNDEYL